MFDVPEKNRPYRDHLRAFLKQNRFGYLQRSVWVTPRDVRPDYDDLNKAAAVDTVAFLFESQTVLGFGPQSVVREAWNFERIHQLQQHYIQVANENLLRLKMEPSQQSDLIALLQAENHAYAQAFSIDPLLPKELHPPDYLGPQVVDIHHQLIHQTIQQL
jgi:DNA-binding transcriptional regulator PaaX